MPVPLKERMKIAQQISRIESGVFDANDVDGVLIKLRPYAASNEVFREISDFVAHADARHRGIAHGSMTAFADRMRFLMEYDDERKRFDITKPFHSYVIRLFKSQAMQADSAQLMNRFRLSPASLVQKIEGNFEVNKLSKSATLRAGKRRTEFLGALQYVMRYLHVRAAFHLMDFHVEFKNVMRSQGIVFDEAAFDAQRQRMGLAILCLISGASVALPDGENANCKLGTKHHFRILQGERRLPTGDVTSDPNTFGTLRIMAEVPVLRDGMAPASAGYSVIDSDLDPHEHCDPSLFLAGDERNEFGPYRIQVINFAPDMSLSRDFKLVRSDSVASL